MKILKGCLIIFLIFFIGLTISILVFNRINSKQILIDNEIPKSSLNNYKGKILERNDLILDSKLPDSIKVLARKSDSLIKNYKKLNDNLWTEYKINQYIYQIDLFKNINNQLNDKYIQYNSDAKDFNSKSIKFPYNIFLSDNNLRSYDLMYLIDYGKDNSENMIKRKKVDHWINTGEVIE